MQKFVQFLAPDDIAKIGQTFPPTQYMIVLVFFINISNIDLVLNFKGISFIVQNYDPETKFKQFLITFFSGYRGNIQSIVSNFVKFKKKELPILDWSYAFIENYQEL